MILDKSYIMRIYISYIIKYHPISNQFLDSMLNSEMIVMLVLLERILFWRKPWPQGPIDNPNSIATMSVLSRSHRFHIVFHIVFHTVFLSSCFSLWFFHRFPSPLRSTEVSLGHPLRRGPWPWHPRFRLGKLGILGSNKFAVSRSLGNEGQWGAMEKNMENDGKLEICTVSYCIALSFSVLCTFLCGLTMTSQISRFDGGARWELWFRLPATLNPLKKKAIHRWCKEEGAQALNISSTESSLSMLFNDLWNHFPGQNRSEQKSTGLSQMEFVQFTLVPVGPPSV